MMDKSESVVISDSSLEEVMKTFFPPGASAPLSIKDGNFSFLGLDTGAADPHSNADNPASFVATNRAML